MKINECQAPTPVKLDGAWHFLCYVRWIAVVEKFLTIFCKFLWPSLNFIVSSIIFWNPSKSLSDAYNKDFGRPSTICCRDISLLIKNWPPFNLFVRHLLHPLYYFCNDMTFSCYHGIKLIYINLHILWRIVKLPLIRTN